MSGQLNVQRLGKSYRTWNSEFRRIASWFFTSVKPNEEKWVLRDVSFKIASGEAIGIIGQNGAGKSTLLKLITGTAVPSEGSVNAIGRVAAILELGMGFSPDLTGRQNATHAAGLMGYQLDEIAQSMPEIEAFAEIGEYFDQPVRTYSSGMQMRVAFSVATAFVPDLLIVDEALSVGDSYFQHKSFDKIRSLKDKGVSIMLVSHSIGDIRALCDRVILLDKGKVIKDGPPDEVTDFYNSFIAEKEGRKEKIQQQRKENGWVMTKSGTGEVKILAARIVDSVTRTEISIIQVNQVIEIEFDVAIEKYVENLVLGCMIRNKQGHLVWGTNTWHTKQVEKKLYQGDRVNYRLTFKCALGPGSYSISPALVSSDTHLAENFEWVDNLLVFEVVNLAHEYFMGSSFLDARFNVNRNAKESLL